MLHSRALFCSENYNFLKRGYSDKMIVWLQMATVAVQI